MPSPSRAVLLGLVLLGACTDPAPEGRPEALPVAPADETGGTPEDTTPDGTTDDTTPDDTVEAATDATQEAIEAPGEVEPLVAPAQRARVTRPPSTRADVDLTIVPPGLSITIPYIMTLGAVLHGRALARLERCVTVYSRVIDAALPPAAMALHTQQDDLCQTTMMSGRHARVYVLDEPLVHVARAIRAGAESAVGGLRPGRARRTSPDERAQRTRACREAFPEWTHVFVDYALDHGDYGESVSMDFLLRRFGAHTVVVAVLHHGGVAVQGPEDSLDALIRSVQIGEPDTARE